VRLLVVGHLWVFFRFSKVSLFEQFQFKLSEQKENIEKNIVNFFIFNHKNSFPTHPITCFYDKNSLSRHLKCHAYFVEK
jgi:hypothetical protein